MYSFLSNDRIEQHVMLGGFQVRHALQIVGEAHQQRLVPYPPRAAEREGAIVIAATHAEAHAPRIEAHQRQEHQVEPARADHFTPDGLGDPEAIEALPFAHRYETHAAGAALDAREIEAAAAMACPLDQRCGIELFGQRGIERDALSRTQVEGMVGVMSGKCRGPDPLRGRYRATLGPQRCPQLPAGNGER